MFLNELNKKESIAFISLVQALAKVDDEFAQKEKDLINEYIEELSLEGETRNEFTLEAAIKEIEGSTDKVKNSIYFELVGLALVDGTYDEKEVTYLNTVAKAFAINDKRKESYINYFQLVKDSYDTTAIEYESKIEKLKNMARELVEV